MAAGRRPMSKQSCGVEAEYEFSLKRAFLRCAKRVRSVEIGRRFAASVSLSSANNLYFIKRIRLGNFAHFQGLLTSF